MKKLILWLLLIPAFSYAQKSDSPYPFTVAQDSAYIRENYQKMEFMVQMRDGIKLFTQVYAPKDQSKKYPILMQRTPYTCSPYGTDKYKKRIGPNPFMLRSNYIVVYQDVRGRWASEGKFVEMTPQVDIKKGKTDIDESSDTYDTIEWLIKNISNNNGKVGQWGISYPGFFTSAGAISEHPALKASSPQAPMADLWRDDAFHNGAFMIAANFGFYNFFQEQTKPTTTRPPVYFETNNPDGYDFYLNEVKTTKNSEDGFYKGRNVYYHENFEHPDYDEHWKKRNILPHLKGIKHAVMVVGGWYDEQDLYGTFNTYKAIEKQNPNIKNIFVVGPWVHGGWAGSSGQMLADVDFGSKVSPYYQENIEAKFFHHYLIDDAKPLDLPEATLFETGTNKWRSFDTYPAKGTQEKLLYFHPNGKLSFTAPTVEKSSSTYLSDPNHPVPFSANINDGFSASYMVEDQRFAYARPDVLSFSTNVLEKDITLSGQIEAMLKVSTTGTDADWVVKVIDVYPTDAPENPKKPNVVYGNYQQLVRSEIIRGKYRDNVSKPKPFVPNQVTNVKVELQDVLHTFKKGHKIMVQIQSSCFPWADRNPQKFMDIFKAEPSDYQNATQKVYHQKAAASYLKVGVLE
ncbi:MULTISPECIES: CocE/NonD family hydrolase [unclassified Arcicella]|uniref:CocE/NonD family hydrolase n=1 Tax=unclassified Arcicella TaxID=2644986 RepID=UPI00285704DF|nr:MULTISPECIES: CocE/NonD family hydrolase [unclassified Arcicella]MDR6562523.1 putative CocE/NonD family hydrolase [Arcicella sp. BE51]MDR6812610.1 putative CocE/NonD family hydrolase [Arcicella sp. BE140]MDR6823922.1 putative CocE/NonD family hydrolase [Arcicella sp. BE139]